MLSKDPYRYICNWVEDILPHTGRYVFGILSLMIPSLIIPDIPYKGRTIRSNINSLFISPSGSGKTSISELFSYLAYNPIEIGSMTSARLESELNEVEFCSLIFGDFSRMSKDPNILKILEGLMGEEKKVSRKTMRGDYEGEKDAIGLICGVPGDLSGHLTSGLIFRVCPIIVFHEPKEHEEIGEYINSNIGIADDDSRDMAVSIREYYRELLNIQGKRNSEINKIAGYEISNLARNRIIEEWKSLTTKSVKATRLNWFRELHEAYRFLFSHAFLNIFNREINNDILIPNDEDLDVAISLMKSNIVLKKKLLSFEGFVRKLKSIKELDRILKSKNLNDTDRRILKSLVK